MLDIMSTILYLRHRRSAQLSARCGPGSAPRPPPMSAVRILADRSTVDRPPWTRRDRGTAGCRMRYSSAPGVAVGWQRERIFSGGVAVLRVGTGTKLVMLAMAVLTSTAACGPARPPATGAPPGGQIPAGDAGVAAGGGG